MAQNLGIHWQRDDRTPVWQQIEQLTPWRGDEAKSIAYRIEWDGMALEDAVRAEVTEAMGRFGIEPGAIKDIVLVERWGVLFCAGIVIGRLKSMAEHRYITDYLAQHTPAPPEPVTLSGVGETMTEPLDLPDEVCRVVATHTGSGTFVLTAQSNRRSYHHLLVNRFGDYYGSTLLQGLVPYALDIQADGSWSITIEALPITHRPMPVLSGSGDMVSDRFMPLTIGSMLYRFTYTGRSDFVVKFHNTQQSMLVQNTIGPVHQQVPIVFPPTLCWWEVKTEGTWRIEPAWKT